MKNNKKNKKEKINGFLNNLPVYILEVSEKGKLINANNLFLDEFGYDKNGIIGLDFEDVFKTNKSLDIKKFLNELEEIGHIENRKLIIKTKKGEAKDVLVDADTVKNEKDEDFHFVFVFIDIFKVNELEKKRDEYLHFLESIEKINNTIRQTVGIKQMMNDTLDVVLSVLEVDRAWFAYPCDPNTLTWSVPVMRSAPEWPGLTPVDNIPITPEAKKVFEDALSIDGSVAYDEKTKRELPPSAKKDFVKSQLTTALYPKIGKPWLFGLHQNSYARIWNEDDKKLFEEIGYRLTDALTSLLFLEELKESKDKFGSLIQTAPVLIIQLDLENKLTEFNKEAERLFGEKKKNVLGKDYLKTFLPKETRKLVAKEIREILSGKITKGFENDVISKLGKIYKTSWNSIRLLDKNDKVIGIIAVGQDITERKKNEKDLKDKIEQLEKTNKMMVGRETKMIELKKSLNELGSKK